MFAASAGTRTENHLSLPEPGIVKTGIEDGETVCSHYRTFERIQGDPRGVSDGPKRDMCSRVELIFKNYPDLYVPINPIFFPKLDGMN